MDISRELVDLDLTQVISCKALQGFRLLAQENDTFNEKKRETKSMYKSCMIYSLSLVYRYNSGLEQHILYMISYPGLPITSLNEGVDNT